MTWTDFYLLCFIVGFTLSVLSFLGVRLTSICHFKWHVPFHGWHRASGLVGRGMSGHGMPMFGAASHGSTP